MLTVALTDFNFIKNYGYSSTEREITLTITENTGLLILAGGTLKIISLSYSTVSQKYIVTVDNYIYGTSGIKIEDTAINKRFKLTIGAYIGCTIISTVKSISYT